MTLNITRKYARQDWEFRFCGKCERKRTKGETRRTVGKMVTCFVLNGLQRIQDRTKAATSFPSIFSPFHVCGYKTCLLSFAGTTLTFEETRLNIFVWIVEQDQNVSGSTLTRNTRNKSVKMKDQAYQRIDLRGIWGWTEFMCFIVEDRDFTHFFFFFSLSQNLKIPWALIEQYEETMIRKQNWKYFFKHIKLRTAGCMASLLIFFIFYYFLQENMLKIINLCVFSEMH